ncbi:MAG TPA: PAS domain S-box protein [Acetobacteraceae bacterium]|nr:PAS domain S-box protein [Acetobacteraceae bacterium]
MKATTIAAAPGPSDLPQDRNLLAALDVACAIIRDLDGTIRFWSAGAERLYGFSPQDALGRRSHDLLATRFPRPLEAIQALLLTDGEWHGELKHQTRDAREIVVASRWAVQCDPHGRANGIVEINHDVTFQQPALAAARWLAAIVESSNDAIIGKTLDGTITAWNYAAEAMFGWRAAEIVGQPVTVLFPPDRTAEEVDILTRIRHGGRVDQYQTVRRRKDGGDFPVSVTVSPIRDSEGAIVGASKIVRDLSAQQETARRLRDAQAELFHVQRLTELGQLVSALVHEVNQPLAAIGNYAAAGRRLLGAGQSAGANVALQKIVEQTERAHQIIQRMRGFVKKGESEQRPELLAAMVQEAVGLALVSHGHDQIALATSVPDAMQVTVDRIQVQQVLFNLLRNALEAMAGLPHREIAITARDEGGMVEVAVADTGPGLSPEVRANLFRPFVTTKNSGMGVGLSVCRSIIEMHGGRLWAEDNAGGGTVFRFTLPSVPGGEVTQT